MNKQHNNQHELILDQFSRQAIPFSKMPGHSNQSEFDQIIKTSGVTEEDNVLDIACGPGLVSIAFAKIAKNVTGIDITQAMIDRASQLQAESALENLTWKIGDVIQLPYKDNSFSMILTRYSFHHFLDPKIVLQEMKRVCIPGGRIVIIDVAPLREHQDAFNYVERLRDPSHTKALTPDELINFAKELDLQDLKTDFYRLEMELENQLAASFPNPGDDDKIRGLFENSLINNNLGMGTHMIGNEIHFAYPVMMLVGKK